MTALERSAEPGVFALYAIEYATRDGQRGQHFHGLGGGWAEPHATSYFVWVALSPDRTIVVDAGIHPDRTAALTGLNYRGAPPDLLRGLGVPPESVDTVILTHLHYDHSGTVAGFPRAQIILQQAELDYWTGPTAERVTHERWLKDAAAVDVVQAAIADGRCRPADGDAPVVAGIDVHLVGGHTAGMQIVSVTTVAGRAVIASDAAHFYENLDDDRPGEIFHDVPGVYRGFDRISELADNRSLIVAGHDPQTMARFAVVPGTDGVPVARIA